VHEGISREAGRTRGESRGASKPRAREFALLLPVNCDRVT